MELIYMNNFYFKSISFFIFGLNVCLSIDLGNVALNKPATQISTYIDGDNKWSARHAVDGYTNCVNPPTWEHYSATNATDYAWWHVDLQYGYNIYRIIIRGKPYYENREVSEFRVFLTEDLTLTPDIASAVFTSWGYGNGMFVIPVSKRARFCLIQNTEESKPITLCEVEIHAQAADLIQQIKPSISTRMSSISTYSHFNNEPNWASSNSVDDGIHGDPDTCNCCSKTKKEQNPWLQIDLGRPYSVDMITVFGRPDGVSREEYKDIFVFVSNFSMEKTNGQHVFNGDPNDGGYIFNIILKQPLSFRYLIIKRFDYTALTICQVKLRETKNLIDILINTVKTSQSSVYEGKPESFGPPKAIDRIGNYSIDSCECCSVTKGGSSWWQLDLGNKFLISAVEVFGRQSGEPQQLQNAVIYVSNEPISSGLDSATNVFTVTAITETSHFIQQLKYPVVGQYLIITLENNILALCEFNVYGVGPFCEPGRYGDYCTRECHCADGQQCHSTTGICPTNQCQSGWQGYACNQAAIRNTSSDSNVHVYVAAFVGPVCAGLVLIIIFYLVKNKMPYKSNNYVAGLRRSRFKRDIKNDHHSVYKVANTEGELSQAERCTGQCYVSRGSEAEKDE